MAGILVAFEVLPEEGPHDKSASQVCFELTQQLSDPGSTLLRSDFSNFAAGASLNHASASLNLSSSLAGARAHPGHFALSHHSPPADHPGRFGDNDNLPGALFESRHVGGPLIILSNHLNRLHLEWELIKAPPAKDDDDDSEASSLEDQAARFYSTIVTLGHSTGVLNSFSPLLQMMRVIQSTFLSGVQCLMRRMNPIQVLAFTASNSDVFVARPGGVKRALEKQLGEVTLSMKTCQVRPLPMQFFAHSGSVRLGQSSTPGCDLSSQLRLLEGLQLQMSMEFPATAVLADSKPTDIIDMGPKGTSGPAATALTTARLLLARIESKPKQGHSFAELCMIIEQAMDAETSRGLSEATQAMSRLVGRTLPATLFFDYGSKEEIIAAALGHQTGKAAIEAFSAEAIDAYQNMSISELQERIATLEGLPGTRSKAGELLALEDGGAQSAPFPGQRGRRKAYLVRNLSRWRNELSLSNVQARPLKRLLPAKKPRPTLRTTTTDLRSVSSDVAPDVASDAASSLVTNEVVSGSQASGASIAPNITRLSHKWRQMTYRSMLNQAGSIQRLHQLLTSSTVSYVADRMVLHMGSKLGKRLSITQSSVRSPVQRLHLAQRALIQIERLRPEPACSLNGQVQSLNLPRIALVGPRRALAIQAERLRPEPARSVSGHIQSVNLTRHCLRHVRSARIYAGVLRPDPSHGFNRQVQVLWQQALMMQAARLRLEPGRLRAQLRPTDRSINRTWQALGPSQALKRSGASLQSTTSAMTLADRGIEFFTSLDEEDIGDGDTFTEANESGSQQDSSRPLWLDRTIGAVNVAVVGESGAGKSLLINKLRNLQRRDEGWAAVGVSEETMGPTMYPFPNEPRVRFWDLPGSGTTSFPREQYLALVGLRHFDAVLVVSAGRFSEIDAELVKELEDHDVPFFMVRSKVDMDVYNNYEDNLIEGEATLQQIRADLAQRGVNNPYLVSCRERSSYDMMRLLRDIFSAFQQLLQMDATLLEQLLS